MTEIRTDEIGFGNLKLLQNPAEFCYGVDAVILADFAASICEGFDAAVDLGTGTGIVPFVLSHKAEKPDCRIIGLDFNEDMIGMAKESSCMNGLQERIHFFAGDVADLADCRETKSFIEDSIWQKALQNGGFDLVTSNPPYFAKGSGIISGAAGKYTARHETTADLEAFIRAASRILRPRGQFFMVHRPSRLVDIFTTCRKYRLEPKTIRFVVPKKGQPPNIVLLHCVLGGGKELHYMQELPIYDGCGKYSREIETIYER